MTVVMDASVAVKAFIAEADSASAVALLAGPIALIAPELIRLEVFSAFCKQYRLGGLDALGVEDALGRWESYLSRGRLVLTPDANLLRPAALLSVKLKHALQDCLYLALAEKHRAPLVTADHVFLRRAKPHYPDLRPLGLESGSAA